MAKFDRTWELITELTSILKCQKSFYENSILKIHLVTWLWSILFLYSSAICSSACKHTAIWRQGTVPSLNTQYMKYVDYSDEIKLTKRLRKYLGDSIPALAKYSSVVSVICKSSNYLKSFPSYNACKNQHKFQVQNVSIAFLGQQFSFSLHI